jgi:hypothetical protein
MGEQQLEFPLSADKCMLHPECLKFINGGFNKLIKCMANIRQWNIQTSSQHTMDNRLISNDTAYRECAQDTHVHQSVTNNVKGAM